MQNISLGPIMSAVSSASDWLKCITSCLFVLVTLVKTMEPGEHTGL